MKVCLQKLIRIGYLPTAFGISCCIFSPKPKYPISEGRYHLVSNASIYNGDSLIYEFLPGHLYHFRRKQGLSCVIWEHKGSWEVIDDENLTYLVDSVTVEGEVNKFGCINPKPRFRRETERAGYYKIRDITNTSFSQCNGEDCANDNSQWYKYEK